MTSMAGTMGMGQKLAGPTGRTGSRVPGHKVGQIQQYTPQQVELFKQLFSNVGPDSYLSKLAGGDQSQFADVEAPALRQFNELTGGLASRFSGTGGGQGQLQTGGRQSSGFQNTLTSASQNFAEQLRAQRQGLQRQALQDLMGISNDLLEKRPYQTTVNPRQKKPSLGGGLIGGALGGIGGFLAGGPMGAATGAKMGYDIGSGGSTQQSFGSSGNKDWLYEGVNFFDRGA